MSEVRLAQKGEIDRQKKIWKLCFGDEDKYIDLHYANRYKEDETVLLLSNGEINAMLTIIPVKIVTPNLHSYDSVMLYAIATHPQYWNKGLASQLMDFTNEHLRLKKQVFSFLVPAEQQLFEFYYKQGYQVGFYLREVILTREMIENLPIRKYCQGLVSAISPAEYNRRRIKQTDGKLYISYADEDIAYQKELSKLSGADIYALDFAEIQGCVAIERVTLDKVFIKEILLPEELINLAIKLIAQLISAKEYVVRTPSFLGEDLGGTIRPFGMFRVLNGTEVEILPSESGYLGLAFD